MKDAYSLCFYSLCVFTCARRIQQKMNGAFDRLSQTCSVTLIMQMTFTSCHHSDVQALAVELASTAAMLGLGWVGGCVCACERAMVPWDMQKHPHFLAFRVFLG